MRRLVSFIVLAAAIVLGVMFNIIPELNRVHSGFDYTSGREFVYRITDSENEEADIASSDVNRLVDVLEDRLNRANVNRYLISIEGTDQIRVAVHANTIEEYAHIKQLMNYNGKFELSTTDGVDFATADQIFKNSVARVSFKVGSPLPYIVIPISNKQRVEELRIAAQELDTGSEEEPSVASRLILWANREDGDNYDFAMSGEEGSEKVQQKMLMAFNYSDMYFDDNKSEISQFIGVTEEEAANPNAVANAVKKAQQYVNLLNAGPIDLEMEYLFDLPIDSLIEDFIVFGTISMINNSMTLFALVVAFVLVALLACLFYRVGGVALFVNLLTTFFLSLMLFNIVGMEFNIAAIIGILSIIVINIVSSVIHLEALKEEVYKGRSLKKANLEANKKAFFRVIDIHVVLLVLSISMYFLAPGMLQSLGAIGAIGSLVSFVVNFTVYRLLMWLATNDTSLQDKQFALGIRKELVPDLKKEEKPQFHGPFAETDFTINSKKKGLIALITTGVFGVGMLLVSVFGSGAFAKTSQPEISRVYFEVHEYSDNYKNLTLDDISAKFNEYKIKFDSITESKRTDENDELIRYYYIDLASYTTLETMVGTDKNVSFETVAHTLYSTADHNDTITIRQVRIVGDPTDILMRRIFIAAGISLVAITIYMALRYNAIRALSALVMNLATAFVTIAFFSITRMSITPATMLAVIDIVLMTSIFSIIVAERQKASRDANVTTIEAKKSVDVKSLSFAAVALLIISVVFSLIVLNFLAIGPEAYMTVFAGILIGNALSLLAVLALFIPLQHFLEKLFAPVVKKFKKDKVLEETKRGNIKDNRSTEPEEAIFIGIND